MLPPQILILNRRIIPWKMRYLYILDLIQLSIEFLIFTEMVFIMFSYWLFDLNDQRTTGAKNDLLVKMFYLDKIIFAYKYRHISSALWD